jgi:DNA-binding MarR family transcriptional regulator
MPTSGRTSPAHEVEAVADRLHAAALHLLRRLRVEDEAMGLSAPRLSALSVLVFGGPMRIGALAGVEQVEPPTMTRLADGLERDGYVNRLPDPQDRRAVVVRATPTGIRVLRRAKAQRVAALASHLGELSARELAALAEGVEVLERLLG